MNSIYLDIGNTFLKMAYRVYDTWNIAFKGDLNSLDELNERIKKMEGYDRVLISSVRKDIVDILVKKLPELKIRQYNTSDIPPGLLDYKTPGTLGFDRFLVCLAAVRESGTNVVVIDSGSACTVDLMTADDVYRGGVIIPGLSLWRKSVQSHLPELPEVPQQIPEMWPGKSTVECIGWGVNGAFIEAIRGFINRYKTMFDRLDIYVTGGDAEKIVQWLGREQDLKHRKHLIWEGMREFDSLLNE